MYRRSTRNFVKLFSCLRIKCIDTQLEIVLSYLAAIELDVIGARLEIVESYLASLELEVLALN